MVVIMRDDYKPAHAHGGEQVRDFQVEVSLKLQEGLLKGVKDAFNYGFYEPPYNGKSGKFMDEERTFRDYPQRSSPAALEFKYKRRVYKSMQYDGKTLQKVHTKSNLKKLLDCVTSNSVVQVSKWTDKGLDPNFQDDKSGETPLTTAVTLDDRQDLIVALVNGGAHLDYRAGGGLTPMHKAAVAGKARSIKILLDLGCPPNIKDPKDLTPLYYSVLHGGDPYCCELLLNEHAEIGVCDHQGMQEIHHACKKGLVQHLEHLVFYGANIDATTASGNTPLHITAVSNHEECARALLFRGARRDILNYANQSVYEVAAVAGNKELAEFIRTFSDGQIVKFTEKPSYSTRRRKSVQKPKASSLFARSSQDTHSNKSDSSLPPSPRSSLSGSHRSSSNADTISLEENGPINGRQRSTSVCSTTSESSYCSEPEDMSLNERRSRAQKNRTRDVEYPSGKMAPPVKIVSGAATVRKRLYAANAPGRRYIAVKDYVPCMGGELHVERGDIVEVLYVGERGFWEGRIENRTGWFPSLCVEELKKGDKARPKTLFGRPPSFAAMFAKNDMQDPRTPQLPDHRFIQPPRVVILNRGNAGFGFQMRGANCQTPRLNFKPSKEFPALQYIGEVEPGGEADFKGVKNDDFIIEVNDEDITTATHSHVVNLIKRSGHSVKLRIVTVPPNIVNGVDTLDYTDGGYRGNSRVPPPLPQRDPSTTLTLGRMRTNSRPSLFDAGLVYSHEEPASFQVDSVIAVSKDSPWHTLQRRKPGVSNSRSAAQFKFNGTSKSKSRNGLSADQRSHSMQNIASSSPYDTISGKRPVKDSPRKTNKPPLVPKTAVPPPPPPAPPVVPPVAAPVKPKLAIKPVKGKKPDMPLTAVRQGLITVDALQAKRGKLKAVKNDEMESPKSSKSIHSMIGRLAGQGGRSGAKPTPAFGGNQHAHLLAKAVAARAATLANEARESEHDSPSSWEDETSSPNIPYSSNPPKPIQSSPKKTPPPVPPKKKSLVPGHIQYSPRPESDSPNRKMLFPPRVGEYNDRPYDTTMYPSEEDRTMMIFDDILRKEVE
ncbi:hypothetical protein QZH41_012714, partial [Actinostola sp. cb2023]